MRKRRLIILVGLSALILSAMILGQDQTESDQSQMQIQSAAGAPDSAALIQFLQQNPEADAELKKVLANRLRDQGYAVDEQSITDDVLYKKLSDDASLSRAAVRWLTSQGYMDDAEASRITGGEIAVDQNLGQLDSQGDLRSQTSGQQPEDDVGSRAVSSPLGSADAGRSTAAQSRRLHSQASVAQQSGTRDETNPFAEHDLRSQWLNPYPDLPSFRDLYDQVPDQDKPVKRFGMDLFRAGLMASSNSADVPAGPDYVLGPGDSVMLYLWGGVSQRIPRTVDREGRLELPEAGPVVVAGLTIAQAQRVVQDTLAPQYRNIHADISLSRIRNFRIYVVGEVQRPGAYDISALATPLSALYAAGGPTARGSLRAVRHMRGTQLVREVDFYDFLLRGIRSDVDRLQPGDTIVVPLVGKQVTVNGTVRRPGIYELKNETRLSDALDLAGGPLVSATMRDIKIQRIEAHEKRVLLSIDLSKNVLARRGPAGGGPGTGEESAPSRAIDTGDAAIKQALDSFQLQDGDAIILTSILPYSEKTVYLQGHVFRPGKLPYRDGMQISDVLRSYQDLLPEPADRAEIIRLSPPDYRPHTIEFKLSEVLTGDDPITLQPFDTVRVFGRYESDAPKVAIYGEVLRPGSYPLSSGMTAADLVRVAGGFKRSALSDTADVASYVVQDGHKVLTRHTTVAIAKALAGDASADVPLKPGDVVSVRQITGWRDIGASITLQGEVLYPGTYGIQEGERLSSVLKRAGGFRSTAYPAGAVLEREEVRELGEKGRQETIRRIEAAGVPSKLGLTTSGSEQAAMVQAMMAQQQQVLARMKSQSASGRLVIKVSPDIASWENTPADIEVRAGDALTIPKRPNFILVNGQVYNASAITHVPGKSAGWYLRQAGGMTQFADKKELFIIRANGSVVSSNGNGSWFKGSLLNTKLQPGDTIVVPERVVGGSLFWKNLLTSAQVTSSLAIAARVATSF